MTLNWKTFVNVIEACEFIFMKDDKCFEKHKQKTKQNI